MARLSIRVLTGRYQGDVTSSVGELLSDGCIGERGDLIEEIVGNELEIGNTNFSIGGRSPNPHA